MRLEIFSSIGFTNTQYFRTKTHKFNARNNILSPSVHHIFEFRAVFTLLLLPNHPPLDCRVSGLVDFRMHKKIKNLKMLRMDGHTDRPESHVHPSKTISIVLENIIYSRSMRLSIGEYNYKLNLEKSWRNEVPLAFCYLQSFLDFHFPHEAFGELHLHID